jgi:ABC-type phosphate transport system permease subunit
MVAAFEPHETVFTVLGDAARKRSARSLVVQLVLSGAIAAAIMTGAPRWWSFAFLAGWSATYSAWGLLVRLRERESTTTQLLGALMTAIAALGTVLAIAGIIGIGLAIYLGDAAGAKNRCGRGSTSPRCQASAHPPAAFGRVVP